MRRAVVLLGLLLLSTPALAQPRSDSLRAARVQAQLVQTGLTLGAALTAVTSVVFVGVVANEVGLSVDGSFVAGLVAYPAGAALGAYGAGRLMGVDGTLEGALIGAAVGASVGVLLAGTVIAVQARRNEDATFEDALAESAGVVVVAGALYILLPPAGAAYGYTFRPAPLVTPDDGSAVGFGLAVRL